MSRVDGERFIGPWRVCEALGRGGMGVVHRAVHRDTGREVAIKTVRVPNQRMLAGIRREIYALARLRHPGIVRILEEGIDAGVPWYAMELLEGSTLRASLASRPPPRAPSAGARMERLAPMARLCSALAFLHGEGIVHRDLKPENVVLRSDGSPVLVDFGLMTRFGGDVSREAFDVLAEALGSLPYMAPEQVKGELCDARADLYAVGCILYEILTGRPPFLGGTAYELMAQHVSADPLRPSRVRRGIPPELDRLVLQLLAKEPRKRLGHADVVIEVLERLGLSRRGEEEPPPRAYLYRPGLSGRSDLLASFRRRVGDAGDGRGGLVFLCGESGSGKTRLAMAIGGEARRMSTTILAGESHPTQPGSGTVASRPPLQALRGPLLAIADRCRERGFDETERLLGSRAPLLAHYEPALLSIPGIERYDAPQDLPAGAARDRLHIALRDTFGALASQGSVLLLLEDLHGADELTIGFLDMLQRSGALDGRGLLVVGTFRTDEAPDALLSLCDRPGATFVNLGPLDETAVGRIVSDMLALPDPPAGFVRALGERSRGNPFFVAEYLRVAVAERLLDRDESGRWILADMRADDPRALLPLPESLRDLVRRRLHGLADEVREIVDAAAVATLLDRDVTVSELAAMTSAGELAIEVATSRLLARQVLEESERGRLRFVHDQIREVAYEIIEEPRRRELHRDAAEALESAPDRASRLAHIGRHWEEAGDASRACACYAPAAVSAAKRYAYQEAETLDRAYIRLAPEGEARVEARAHLADSVLMVQGRLGEARAECERALDESRRLGSDRMRLACVMAMGNCAWSLGETETARAMFDEALALSRMRGDRRREGIVLNVLGMIAQRRGDKPEARRLFEDAIALVHGEGDARSEGMITNNLASVLRETGAIAEAEAVYRKSLAVFLESGDRRGSGVALGNLGLLAMELGRLEEARPLYEQALGVHREVGNRRSEAMVLGNLATLDGELGRPDLARGHLLSAIAILREIGDRDGEAIWLSALAGRHADDGDAVEARRLAGEALALARVVKDRRVEGVAQRILGTADRLAGDAASARARHAEAEELLSSVDRIELARTLVEIALADRALGRDPAEVVARARTIAAEMGVSERSPLGRAIAKLIP